MARTDRLLTLTAALRRHRGPVTAEALALELGTSTRSIYRDIADLRDRGAKIVGETGVGFQLAAGLTDLPMMLSDDEIDALVHGLLVTRASGDPAMAATAARVIAKVRAVLPEDLRQEVDDAALFVPPPEPAPTVPVDLALVRRTIRDGRHAMFEYTDRQDRLSNVMLWPIALASIRQTRVVIGWCEERSVFRAFRTDRAAKWRCTLQRAPRSHADLLSAWRADGTHRPDQPE